jgi:hypothetical protein
MKIGIFQKRNKTVKKKMEKKETEEYNLCNKKILNVINRRLYKRKKWFSRHENQ